MQCEFEEHEAEDVRKLEMRANINLWVCKTHYDQERRRRAARGIPMPAWDDLERRENA
ncbi:MAG: hypothetical protein AB7N91_16465 [Candidatus Tectimicrobiota bacterium]